jgi:isopropylmalate/homocitrate/citramalate synthase
MQRAALSRAPSATRVRARAGFAKHFYYRCCLNLPHFRVALRCQQCQVMLHQCSVAALPAAIIMSKPVHRSTPADAEGAGTAAGDLSSPKETKYTLDYYMAMAEAIVEHGCHAIGIKDMAGLLKPHAATTLIGALRERFPNTVLHVHTHDSAGTAVATQLAAAAAGADIADLAMDAMSGCTSQARVLQSRLLPSLPLL